MRRVVVMSIIGLALAFGAFYVFSWPTTLSGSKGNELAFPNAKPGELLHSGLMHFEVAGRREITIVNVTLNEPSAGLELVSSRVGLGSAGASIGSERGDQPAINALPRAPDYVLYPGEAGGFVVSFRAVGAGSFTFHGIIVTYQSGWLTRSVRLGPKVTVTVPASAISPTPTPSPFPS